MGDDLESRRNVIGVDFSAAADAGRRMWIARAEAPADGVGPAEIRSCIPAEELPGSGRDRDMAMAGVRTLLAESGDCVAGLDFPFGLPAPLVSESTWLAFLRAHAQRCPDAATFRRLCREASDGRELKRLTDVETRTPFSPYNLRLHRQTHHGLRDILAPLVLEGRATASPMQPMRIGAPLLLEICPASTLKREGVPAIYKGATDEHQASRRRILKAMEGAALVRIASRTLRRRVLEDAGGDALDAVIAAGAAARAIREGALKDAGVGSGAHAIEGRVFT
ncbi:MAG: DUF429 domain-containing protein [Phycisphaeraceae bacterium]|nr:MAG: DUF429 domain-containing protein [Phycisphaeraceae bacterium]